MELDNFKYNLLKLKKCDQFWDDMEPISSGRHCKSCNKTIVDFSRMSYSEIALFMSKSENPVCGFYLPEQLSAGQKKFSTLPIQLGLSTLLTATTFSYGQTQERQTTYQAVAENSIEKKVTSSEVTSNLVKDTIIIKGKVQSLDTSSKMIEELPFASVVIKGTNIGVACNELGEFRLKYLPKVDTVPIKIVISAVAIQTKEVSIDLQDTNEIDLGLITLDKYKCRLPIISTL